MENKQEYEVSKMEIEKLSPHPRNPRKHPKKQINQLCSAIKEWGFTTAILVDEQNTIIAGHGRYEAALKLGMKEVPVMVAEGWTDIKKMAYLLADNKIGLNSEWDEELLNLELKGLKIDGFNIELTGFEDFSLDIVEEESKYTDKKDAPLYEATGECPDIQEIYNNEKYINLIGKIESTDIDGPVKDFLIAAASRHIKFDFENIAEFYCHSSREVQDLMEESALIIIDYDKAITNGYVKLTEKMMEIYKKEKGID